MGILSAAVVNTYWLILIALVDVNLIVFALSGFCLIANILYKLEAKPRLNK